MRSRTSRRRALAAALLFGLAPPVTAQPAGDLTTVEGVMAELYASVSRAPGAGFQWDRFRAVMLPGAVLVPRPNELDGGSRALGVDSLIAAIDAAWAGIIGTDRDSGVFERQVHLLADHYGDIAHVMSTYEEGPYSSGEVRGRGINSIQLVRRSGRWYIASIVWEEDDTAGPIPSRYMGRARAPGAGGGR